VTLGKVSKKTIVVHSGGMDSSLCLALAIKTFGAKNVLAMSFRYGQLHSVELERAAKITKYFGVDRLEVSIDCLPGLTKNALMNEGVEIECSSGVPSTLVVGRNGLMARLAAIHADYIGADSIYMGVIQLESDNYGYRDCSRDYMNRLQSLLRDDLNNPDFEIRTPLIKMTKAETMQLGHELGVLTFLLDTTITCYRGIPQQGCRVCPACELRNQGIVEFVKNNPDIILPYLVE
jgi:7-cyano-7-deazaguanine synthase